MAGRPRRGRGRGHRGRGPGPRSSCCRSRTPRPPRTGWRRSRTAPAADEGGWVIEGDWAVIAETEEIAQNVVDDAADGSLADDEDFQQWTDEAGDDGVVTMYAGPALGDYLADHVDELFGFPFGGARLRSELRRPRGHRPRSDEGSSDEDSFEDGCADEGDIGGPTGSLISDELEQTLRDFKGMAGVLRFDDGAIELEFASDADIAGSNLLGERRRRRHDLDPARRHRRPPSASGFSEGWFSDLLESPGPTSVPGRTSTSHARGDRGGDRAGAARGHRDPVRRVGGARARLGLRPGRVLRVLRRLRRPGRAEGGRATRRRSRRSWRSCATSSRRTTRWSSTPTPRATWS